MDEKNRINEIESQVLKEGQILKKEEKRINELEEKMKSEIKAEAGAETKAGKNFLEKSVDFLFSNDLRRWLIPIFIVGIILRFFMARNVSMLADEMVHGPHAISFLKSGLISTFAQSPLWFYLQDIFLQAFGVSAFSTRFASFFYGSISILLVYLISAKVFDRKAGIISAALISSSYYLIRYTLMEMDLSAIFFLLMAVYLFLVSAEKNKFPYLAAVALGLAALIKTLSLFFVPAFLIGFFFLDMKKENKREYFIKNIKKCIIFGLIILLLFSPVILHNYLWFKDKGMVDVYFAQYFDIGKVREAYAGQAGYDSGILFPRFFEGVLSMSGYIFKMDPLIVILGILGLAVSFSLKEKRKSVLFLLAFELSGFVFLILSNWLPTHYTTMVPFFCIFGGFFVANFADKLKFSDKNMILLVIILAIFVFQIFFPMPKSDGSSIFTSLTSSCGTCQLRDYAAGSMDKNSLVIADSRIYRGRIAWLFNDFHYLEASYLSQFLELNKNISGADTSMTAYFVECSADDCGWGTVKNQPDFNKSMEDIVSSFSKVSPEKIIYGGGGYGDEEKPDVEVYKVYKFTLNLKPQMLSVADSTHDWFYYPVNYRPKEKIFDQYSVNGADKLLYMLAWIITILSISLALAAPVKVAFDLYREK